MLFSSKPSSQQHSSHLVDKSLFFQITVHMLESSPPESSVEWTECIYSTVPYSVICELIDREYTLKAIQRTASLAVTGSHMITWACLVSPVRNVFVDKHQLLHLVMRWELYRYWILALHFLRKNVNNEFNFYKETLHAAWKGTNTRPRERCRQTIQQSWQWALRSKPQEQEPTWIRYGTKGQHFAMQNNVVIAVEEKKNRHQSVMKSPSWDMQRMFLVMHRMLNYREMCCLSKT